MNARNDRAVERRKIIAQSESVQQNLQMSIVVCRFARRSRAVLTVALVTSSMLTACMGTQHVPFTATSDLDQVTGITLHSGREIEFARTGVSISNDTLYAVDHTGPVAYPTDSVTQLSRDHFSARNTAGLVVGIGAGLFAALLVLALSSPWNIN
jgi:hypothetical protein